MSEEEMEEILAEYAHGWDEYFIRSANEWDLKTLAAYEAVMADAQEGHDPL